TAIQAQAFLDNLFSKPEKNWSPRYAQTQPLDNGIQWYADRSREILSDLSGNPNNFAFFDQTRKSMLDFIVALVQ
ncbi:MAG: hypothetical protein V1777_03345, partial [Candidatus Micrarchaeota archaeon]